jgi:hypothetical protein
MFMLICGGVELYAIAKLENAPFQKIFLENADCAVGRSETLLSFRPAFSCTLGNSLNKHVGNKLGPEYYIVLGIMYMLHHRFVFRLVYY